MSVPLDDAVRTPMPLGRRRRLTAFVGLVGVVLVSGLVGGGSAEGAREGGRTPYERQLQTQVQDAGGAPRAGVDPARQKQSSLAAAAAQPVGTGRRAGVPARGVRQGTIVRLPAEKVLGDPRRTGVISGGCVLGYGTAGAQCLPARGPGNTALTCAYVVTLFPVGIQVTGVDRLRLDSNRDGVACGPRDAGGPPPTARRPSVHQHD